MDGRGVVRRLMVAVAVLAGTLGVAAAPSGAVSDGYWDYRPLSVSGTYQPVVGNFGGDGAADILWYAPGSGADSLWLGNAGKRGASGFTRRALSINGTYRPVIGDFAGDDRDDILWYAPGSGGDYLWTNKGDGTFTSAAKRIGGTYTMYRLYDYRAGFKDDLFLHAVNSQSPSYEWHFSDATTGAYTSLQMNAIGYKRPVVGDWNGDGIEDLFLHGPGASPDLRWLMADDGTWTQKAYTVNGTYQPVVVYQVPNDAILWWGGSSGKEAYWWSNGTDFASKPVRSVDGSGSVATFPTSAAVVWGPFIYDGLFIGDETSGDFYDLAGPGHEKANDVPLIGDFDDDGWTDIVWYKAGSGADELWYLEPQAAGAAAEGLRVDPRVRARS